MIDFEQFVAEFINKNHALKNQAIYIVDKFKHAFNDEDYENVDKICDLFVTSKNTVMQKSSFYAYKQVVSELYLWLSQKNVVSIEICNFVDQLIPEQIITQELILTTYYRDLDSCLDFIETIGKMNRLGNEDDLLPIKSLAIVSWRGYSLNDLLCITKTDILRYQNCIEYPKGNVIEVSDREGRLLKMYAKIDCARSFWAGQTVQYSDSKYLFRSSRSEQLTKDSVKTMMLKFNDKANELTRHSVFLSSLITNGRFHNLYIKNGNDPLTLQMVMNSFKCNAQTAWWYKALYEKWKDIYYPDGGAFI